MNLGKRCLPSRPRGPAPKISPARKGWVHRQAIERRRCGTTLFVCSLERTRISYLTALTGATYVVLPKENHMQLAEATRLDRKSGGAERLQFDGPFVEIFFDRAHRRPGNTDGPAAISWRAKKKRRKGSSKMRRQSQSEMCFM